MMRTAVIVSMAFAFLLCISNEAEAQSLTEYAKKRKAEIAEMQRIEKERYEAAVAKGTLAAFQEFLKQYPDGKYSQDVKNRIADYSLWEEAKRTNTIQAYKQYLLTSQFKTFSAEANAAIEDLQSIDEWQRLKSSKSLIEVKYFIKKYPKSSVLADAERKVHELNGVQYYNNNELLKAYNEFNKAGGRDLIDSSNHGAYDKCVEYHDFWLLGANSEQESLMAFLRNYPNSKYASQVSNWIALSKAKDFTKFSTKTSYNVALSYARDEATRVKVKNLYAAKQREFARYKKQQRVAKRRANGGVFNFGLELTDIALMPNDYIDADSDFDMAYWNVGASVKIGNYRSPVQLEFGIKPGFSVYTLWYGGDDDIKSSFHLPVYTRLKINLFSTGPSSKFYIDGVGLYNAVRDEELEAERALQVGCGVAWRHWDWRILYYKQDFDNDFYREGYSKDRMIGCSLYYYF